MVDINPGETIARLSALINQHDVFFAPQPPRTAPFLADDIPKTEHVKALESELLLAWDELQPHNRELLFWEALESAVTEMGRILSGIEIICRLAVHQRKALLEINPHTDPQALLELFRRTVLHRGVRLNTAKRCIPRIDKLADAVTALRDNAAPTARVDMLSAADALEASHDAYLQYMGQLMADYADKDRVAHQLAALVKPVRATQSNNTQLRERWFTEAREYDHQYAAINSQRGTALQQLQELIQSRKEKTKARRTEADKQFTDISNRLYAEIRPHL